MRFNEINQILTEAKNTHIEHVEDLVFNSGFAGIADALEYVEAIRRMLKPGSGEPGVVTVKYDGAPAIICGTDPKDGKFFVGTKAVFSRESKAIKKPSDVKKFYSDVPGLGKTLLEALHYLRKLGIGGVIQGDFMFDEGSKVNTVIDGKQMVTFTPNTITYAVPLDSALGKKIAKSKFGIIFHTKYDGESLQTLVPTFGVNVSGLNHIDSVWFDNADYKDVTGLASLTDEENTEIIRRIEAIKSAASKTKPNKVNAVIFHKDVASKLKPFINQLVRSGQKITDPMSFIRKFIEYYDSEEQKILNNMKSGPESTAYKNRLDRIEQAREFIEDNMNTFLAVIAIYKNLVELKLDVITKLQQVEGLGVFIKNKDGYRVSNHEGFVAIGRDGNVVKFVDRLDFSRQNFNAVKTWKTD